MVDAQHNFDACMKLAEFGSTRHDRRREYEWKVTLGFWAVIVAGIATLRGHSLPGWWGITAVATYALLWLRGIWVANEKDKQLGIHYRTQAENILVNSAHVVKSAEVIVPWYWWLLGFLTNWSMLFQLVTTIGLVYLAYVFIQ